MTMLKKRSYTWKDLVRIGAGLVMLILGIVGLVLPVLQGVLFLIVAAFLLAPYSRTIRRGLAWSKRRFPRLHTRADYFRNKYFPGKDED